MQVAQASKYMKISSSILFESSFLFEYFSSGVIPWLAAIGLRFTKKVAMLITSLHRYLGSLQCEIILLARSMIVLLCLSAIPFCFGARTYVSFRCIPCCRQYSANSLLMNSPPQYVHNVLIFCLVFCSVISFRYLNLENVLDLLQR